MSQQSMRKKLAKAYSKIANRLGTRYTMYRTVSFNDFLGDQNFLGEVTAAFTLSDTFIKSAGESFEYYISYLNNLDIHAGDCFVAGEDVFIVVWNRGLEEVKAVRAQKLVNVLRETWPETAGDSWEKVKTVYAYNVPVSVAGVGSVNPVLSLPQSNQVAPQLSYELRIWSTSMEIHPTDTIQMDGKELVITSIRPTELCQVISCYEK